MWYRKAKSPRALPANHLRDSALDAASALHGVVVEVGLPDGVTTLIALSDGTTMLCVSGACGMRQVGDDEEVQRRSTTMIAQVNANVALFEPAFDTAPPSLGFVRLYLTGDGLKRVEAMEQDLVAGIHPAAPLYQSAQRVIEAIRELWERN